MTGTYTALWLPAVVLLAASHAEAQLQPPTVAITQTQGSFAYQWTLDKTVQGTPTAANVRITKGVVSDIAYVLKYTRTINTASQVFNFSGTVTATNGANAVTFNTITTKVTGGQTAEFPSTCTPPAGSPVAAGGQIVCTFTTVAYTGYPQAGMVTATLAFTDTVTTTAGTVTADSPRFAYDTVVGSQATATLADKFDLTPLDRLYTGFNNFQRTTVWKYADPATAVPETGVTVSDSDQKSYTIKAGSFVVCTDANGVAITNTATLTPAGGTAITKVATANIVIFGCDVPPTLNFQELQSWGAQTFSWALQSRATRTSFTVDQTAGSVPVEYNLQATATPTTGGWAVSGAVFVANAQAGIMNIARLVVTLSSGQQVIPQCSLTSPYVSPDGLVWGGTNAGGSITTPGIGGSFGVVGTGVTGINGVGIGVGVGLGTFTQFILPDFASATCRFNITLTQQPSSTLTITPQINWGFGGQYTLANQQLQQTVSFSPPQQFFPVQNCISLTDVVQAGSLTGSVANGGPNQQQVCVTGQTAPFQQPAALVYTMTVTINPSTTPDCTPGSQKTYPISNSVTGTVIGGAPVQAKADPVDITVRCPAAAAPTTPTTPGRPINPASAGDVDNLNVQVGQFQTFVGAEYAWAVTKTADNDTLSLAIGQLPKTVTYTLRVTKGAATNKKFFVFGKITVNNPGKTAVNVSTVSVTAGSAAVPATCPPGSMSVAPGVPLVCTFNVTWNNGANSGALGARVDTPQASFYGPAATFDFTNAVQGGTKGATAGVYDDVTAVAPAGATGVPTKWWLADGGSPPPKADGIPLTTEDSRDYVYTMQLGPFADKGSCGIYKVTNVATVVPSDGTTVTATKTVTLSVTGCKTTDYQGVASQGPLGVTVDSVNTANLTGNTWRLSAVATPANLTLASGQGGSAQFTVNFIKVPGMQHEVSGTVTLTNSNPQTDVVVRGVTVAVEGDVAKSVDAVCGTSGNSFKLAGGATQQCTFMATLDLGGGGNIIGSVTDAAGVVTSSQLTPFDFRKADVKDSSTAPSCAQASTGVVVGITEWQAGGTVAPAAKQERICESKTVTVPATITAPKDGQCGTFDFLHISRLQPLAAGAAVQSVATALPVMITCGAAAAAAAAPTVRAATPDVEVQEVYTWTAKLTSNASTALSFKQGEAVKVAFAAETSRSPAQRSAVVSGTVVLEAPAAAPLDIQSATVAVYDGSGQLISAPLDCGAGAKPGGPVTLKGKGQPVTCSYNASGVGTADGAVLPVVIAAGAAAPAVANPVPYKASSAPKNIVGDCADLGSSLLMTSLADGKRAAWQPAFAGQALSSGSDCDGGDLQRFSLWFGANAQGVPQPTPCGAYKFKGTLALAPTNGQAVVNDSEFTANVACRRRRLRELLGEPSAPGRR